MTGTIAHAQTKLSTFPSATTPPGTSDTFIGVQGGVDVQFPALSLTGGSLTTGDLACIAGLTSIEDCSHVTTATVPTSFAAGIKTQTPSGSTLPPNFSTNTTSVTGSVTGGHNAYFNQMLVSNDQLDATNASAKEAIGLIVADTFGGASVTGGRNALNVTLTQTAQTGNQPIGSTFYTGLSVHSTMNATDGGTGLAAFGNLFGTNVIAIVNSGATFINSIVGQEIGTGSGEATHPPAYIYGLQLTQNTVAAAHALLDESAMDITIGNGQIGWNKGISIGSKIGYWPITSTGTLIVAGTLANGAPAGTAAIGLDFSRVTFSNAPIIMPLMTPASSAQTCTTGGIAWDTGFIYICTATNTWKRAALSTF